MGSWRYKGMYAVSPFHTILRAGIRPNQILLKSVWFHIMGMCQTRGYPQKCVPPGFSPNHPQKGFQDHRKPNKNRGSPAPPALSGAPSSWGRAGCNLSWLDRRTCEHPSRARKKKKEFLIEGPQKQSKPQMGNAVW